jgi:hypothetical protein
MKEEGVIMEEQMSYYKDLPQLIVALDKDSNYIHIRDTKDDCEYFCPCCRNSVKPRANKKDKEYQVQAHFYHVNGSCDEESRVHWIYKNWLFKSGSKFYVENTLYEVDYVEIEKTHKTSFGDYRPDITIHTTNNKVILFEVNFSSSKTENSYMEKWCELNYDVVEVNIRKLMNEDYNNEIPRFMLIYKDGECYKKSYATRDDYSEIAKIKKEWKRQDKINYKIMWERLDWFWLTLQNYKHQKETFENVLEAFKCINIKDKEICFDIIKKQSCIKGKVGEFRDIINAEIASFDIKSMINLNCVFDDLTANIIDKKGYFAILRTSKKYGNESKSIEVKNKTHDLKYSNLILFVNKINEYIDKKLETLENINNFISIFECYLKMEHGNRFIVDSIDHREYSDRLSLCVLDLESDIMMWSYIYDISKKKSEEILEEVKCDLYKHLRKIELKENKNLLNEYFQNIFMPKLLEISNYNGFNVLAELYEDECHIRFYYNKK